MLRVFGLAAGLVVLAVAAEVVVVFVVVVVAAGTGVVVVVVLFVARGAAFAGVALEPLPMLPVAGVVVVAGVVTGSVVIGVGSGGNGLDITLAIRSFRPTSDWLCRYLYQVVTLSSHSFLLA